MSNRFHNKWHRHNHSTLPTAGEPDSSHDPIASPSDPFKGSFVVSGLISASCGDSSQWCSTYTNILANSALWTSTYTTVSDTSGNWSSVYSTVLSNSANWGSSVSAVSSLWYSVYTTVCSNSGNWSNTYTLICANSSIWNSVYSTVCSNSGEWESAYSTVCSNSGVWNYNSFLNTNPHVGFLDYNYFPVYSEIDNTAYYGPNVAFSLDSKGQEHVFYISYPGPTLANKSIYKGFMQNVGDTNFYLNASPLVEYYSSRGETISEIISLKQDSLIVRTHVLSASLSDAYKKVSDSRYYLYRLDGTFDETQFNPICAVSLYSTITNDPLSAFSDWCFQYEKYNDGERIIKFNMYNVINNTDLYKHITMSLYDLLPDNSLSAIGNTVTFVSDLSSGFSLFHLNTALSGTYAPYLSSTKTVSFGVNSRLPNNSLQYTYIPTFNTVIGIFSDIWTYTDNSYRHFIVSTHFDVPVDFMDNGLIDDTSITPRSPVEISVSDVDANINMFPTSGGGWVLNDTNSWGHYNTKFSDLNYTYSINKPHYEYNNNDLPSLLYVPIGYDKIKFYNVDWSTMIFSLSTPYTEIVSVEKNNLFEYNLGFWGQVALLSSNCAIFCCKGRPATSTDINSEDISYVVAELEPTRTIVPLLTTFQLSAYSIDFTPESIKPFHLVINGECKVIDFSRNNVVFAQSYSWPMLTTTIDADGDIHYYTLSTLRPNTSLSAWPLYEIKPFISAGSVFLSGQYVRDLQNPISPQQYKYYNDITPSYTMTGQMSSGRVYNYAVSGNNTIYIVSPSPTYDSAHPTNAYYYNNIDIMGLGDKNWSGTQRIVEHKNSTFTLISTPPLTTAFVKVCAEGLTMGGNYCGGTILLDLTDNNMYYGVDVSINYLTRGKRDLNTHTDTIQTDYTYSQQTDFGVCCADGLNIGKYLNGNQPYTDYKMSVNRNFVFSSELDANDGTPPKLSLSEMISSGPGALPRYITLSSTHVNMFSINQNASFIAYLLDYPIFLGGKYYDTQFINGFNTITLNPSVTSYIYLESDYNTNSIKPIVSQILKDNSFTKVKIAKIVTDSAGIVDTDLYRVNAYDIGESLPYDTITNAVSTDIFIKVVVNGKEYGLMLWDLSS